MSGTKMIVHNEDDRKRIIGFISNLKLNKLWQITVEPYKQRRSLAANSLYWKWVGLIAQETGNDPDAVHDALKQKFLVPEEISFMGEKHLYRSTVRLDTKAMKEYMDRVYSLATQELGILLPVPEDIETA